MNVQKERPKMKLYDRLDYCAWCGEPVLVDEDTVVHENGDVFCSDDCFEIYDCLEEGTPAGLMAVAMLANSEPGENPGA